LRWLGIGATIEAMVMRAKSDLQDLVRWLSAKPAEEHFQDEDEFFESCLELARAVKRLERASGTRGSGTAAPAALGFLTDAFGSLANSLLLISEEAASEPAGGQADAENTLALRLLLHAASGNLRTAQTAAAKAGEAAGSILAPD
jgi:hypothetical protein